MGWEIKSNNYKKLNVLLEKHSLENYFKSRVKKKEDRTCPVCKSKFTIRYRKSTTCSPKCRLVYFRDYHFDETSLDNVDDIKKFKFLTQKHTSRNKIILAMKWPDNKKGRQKFNEWCIELNIDTSRFSRIYPKEEKSCPICNKKFITYINHPKTKTTCSHSCANTYFHSGKRDKYKEKKDFKYRDICLRYFEPKCIICGWNITIEIHHIDENAANNKPENLVPLCPNHHIALHYSTEYKKKINKDIQEKLKEYLPLVPLNEKE